MHQGTQSTRRITWSYRWRSDDPEGGVACWGLCKCVMSDKLKSAMSHMYTAPVCRDVCASSSLWAPLFNLAWQNHSINSFHLKRKCTHSSRTLRVNIAIQIRVMSLHWVTPDLRFSITYALFVFIVACQNRCQAQSAKDRWHFHSKLWFITWKREQTDRGRKTSVKSLNKDSFCATYQNTKKRWTVSVEGWVTDGSYLTHSSFNMHS